MELIDSYSESNQNDTAYLYAGYRTDYGQSFTSNGSALTTAKFYLKKSGSPTGNITFRVYAHSGTYGTSSLPTGPILDITGNLDSSTLTTSFALYELTFANNYQTNSGYYVVTVHYAGGDVDNKVIIGQDSSSPTHGGNVSYLPDGGSWTATNAYDNIFYIYGDTISSPATFIATKDNFMQSNATTDNNGASDENLNISAYSASTYRALITFDISSLPEDATITSATFSLYYYNKIGTPSGQNAITYKLKRNDWEEGTKIGAAGDSCWNNYKSGGAWQTAGALGANDYDSSLNATATYGAGYGWMNWDIQNIVEDAITNVSGIVNLLLKFQTEGADYYSYHYPREYITDLSLRPKLVIEYSSGTTVTVTVQDYINITESITVGIYQIIVIAVQDTIELAENITANIIQYIIKALRSVIKGTLSIKSKIQNIILKSKLK